VAVVQAITQAAQEQEIVVKAMLVALAQTAAIKVLVAVAVVLPGLVVVVLVARAEMVAQVGHQALQVLL
jgi:hypothetical protein